MNLPPLSLYIHMPWCIKKCPYCDFNSHAVNPSLEPNYLRYVDALLTDLANDLALYSIERPLQSIFMGGGTPSLFTPSAIERLLNGIAAQIPLAKDLEITLEANPGTFDSGKFAEFYALGINRLSIGIQSFNDQLLANLGRVHSGGEAHAAVEMAQCIGFTNINLDLMFGLPGALPDSSLDDVGIAMRYQPNHISFYQLTLEPNTLFYQFPPVLPKEDDIFAVQKAAQKLLAEHAYQQYEISAYSLAGKPCRHNVNYWQFGDYLGIGAGAHGKITRDLPEQIIRTFKPRHPEQYMQDTHRHGNTHTIALKDLPLEFLMNHLRLKSGFNLQHYQRTTGLSIDSLEPGLTQALNQDLLCCDSETYRCTEKGWYFLDSILEMFLPA